MSKVSIYLPKQSPMPLPLASASVPAGFPSPAEDYIEETLDIHNFLIDNPTATFYARVDGDSMINAGILEGDILVVDRSKTATHNSIVLALVNNEFTVKYLKTKPAIALEADNPDYPAIPMKGDLELVIWGVVTGVARKI